VSVTDDKQINSLIDKLSELRAENKALKEDKADLSGAIEELTEHKKGLMKSYKKLILQYKALKENRDELLKLLKRIADKKDYGWNHKTVIVAIQKAEAKPPVKMGHRPLKRRTSNE